MPFELYTFSEGKEISLSDLLHLTRKRASTVSAIKKQTGAEKISLNVGSHDIAPPAFIHRAKDYILDIDDTGQGILHITSRPNVAESQYIRQEELQEDRDIQMPQQETDFVLVGSNRVGNTVLWAILSYIK